ncbi:MAG: PKD domain-containing protein [Halosimplex sp.]
MNAGDGPSRCGEEASRRGPTASRRELLRRATAGALCVGTGLASGTASAAASADVTLTFEDQTTDGREVVIAELTTSVDVTVSVATRGHETVYARREFEAGSYADHAVALDALLTEDRTLQVSAYPSGGGEALAMDRAEVAVADDVSFVEGVPVTRVDADTDAGFHYPYFLYAPQAAESEAGGPILVEPNNTGTASDDFAMHVERARKLAEGEWNGGSGRTLSERLAVPFLVPAFPRPKSDPVDWHHYVHQLDTETMRIDKGPLERVDRQLVRMVEHARDRLDGTYPVADDGMLLNGFSASGNFVNRFAALQPEEVISVTGGGINGMAILPVEEAKGHSLNYQIGVADVAELTGEPFDLEAFREVNQFLYMGALDTNDTLPYGDAWSDEQREIALDVYGPNMQRDRLPFCKSVYESQGVQAAFKIYEGEGHTPAPAIDDLVAFHRASMAGESIDEFGANVGDDGGGEGAPPRPTLEYGPAEPTAGDPVEFDASGSTTSTGEIVAYTWHFGDGETAAGPRPVHAYADEGGYTVTLTVIDGHGRAATATTELSVEPDATRTAGGETAAPTRRTAATGDPESSEAATVSPSAAASTSRPTTVAEDGAGFGSVAALLGLAGVSARLAADTDGDAER